MSESRRAGLTYLVLTIFLALVCVAVGYQLLDFVLEGKVWAGPKGAKRLVTASEGPVEFGIRILLGFTMWLLLCGYAWLRFRIWMNRDRRPETFASQVAELEKTTSKTGNVLAWIFAVPFILLAVIVVIAVAMGYGPR